MALVMEETQHEPTNVKVLVAQREDGETYEAWRIISVEMDGYERVTPQELRDLGRFLVRESKRIGREYTASGAHRNLQDRLLSDGGEG
jgi:hypothetical protein